jgi:tRNA splicing endonuclease
LESFDKILDGQTAGLPQDENEKWTHLSCTQIVSLFVQKGLKISRYHVCQMLRLRGYKKRKLVKMKDLFQVEQRNEQFEKINLYRKRFTDMNFPILSIDTKKKKCLAISIVPEVAGLKECEG